MPASLRLPFLLSLTLLLLGVISLHLGVRTYSPVTVLTALLGEGTDAPDVIVRELRVPRAVLAVCVGAMLGASGLLMQGATRNPIAEPGLIGVNMGAGLAVVVTIALLGDLPPAALMAVAALGGLLAGALVLGLVAAVAPDFPPTETLLAGVAVSALLGAAVQVVILLDEAVLEELLFWLSGSFADRPLDGLAPALLLLGGCLVWGWVMAPALDALATGDATAGALGVDAARLRLGAFGAAALLAGAGAALAGPVAFVGLAAPHLARMSGTRGHRILLSSSVLWGAVLAVGADIAARYVLHPTEAPISAVMALVGVPLLILLLRRGRA